jgi:WD40 repeat protein
MYIYIHVYTYTYIFIYIGDLYALTSMDGMIYIYKTADFSIKAICKGHTGCVSHMDFSQDGHFIMSNSTVGEVFICKYICK